MTYLDELELRIQSHVEVLKRIELVVFDVDGVLTDGSLVYGENGEITKRFNVKDGVGLKLLSDVGLTVAVISAKQSPMVQARMKDLGVSHYYPGTKNKLEQVESILSELGLGLDEFAFIGDDMVDVKPMQAAGISFCPADAYPMVKEVATLIMGHEGGQGVAREVCDLILAAKGLYNDAYKLTTTQEFERARS